MTHKKSKNQPSIANYASVKKEMTKPRMAKSARIAEMKLNTTRIAEQPSATFPGTVHKIIPPPRPTQPEKARLSVDGVDPRH